MPIEALIEGVAERLDFPERRRIVAKVLLADSDLASRLTLKSVLGKAGYEVEGAATAAEAIARLDASQYQLVLADLRSESEDAGPALLAYARQKDYHPATALITLAMSEVEPEMHLAPGADRVIHMSNEDVSDLLANVAELIGLRADRRMRLACRA
jgi:CheY-like chemotaxis protein